MKAADEMVAKTAPTERQPASAVTRSDDMLRTFDERWLSRFKDLERPTNQRKPVDDSHDSDDELNKQPEDSPPTSHHLKPVEDLDGIIPRVSCLDDETSDHVRAMEGRTKRRSSRGFARFPVAICIGVAGTLAWQSYGEATKQIIAASAPELGWSPEAKQMIAGWVEQLGWTKPPTGPENTAVQLPVPKVPQAASPVQGGAETVTSTSIPAAPSFDQQQVQQMKADIAAVKQTVEQRLAALRENAEQLAVGQDQVLREIAKLHQEILNKIPASSPQLPATPKRKPMPAPASSSPASSSPTPPTSSREPTPLQLPPHP
jgi:hypothetical protein